MPIPSPPLEATLLFHTQTRAARPEGAAAGPGWAYDGAMGNGATGHDRRREADRRYSRAVAFGRAGDREAMVAEWLAVLRLDAAGDASRPFLAPEEFEDVAEQALAELPQDLLDRLGNVAVIVADRPSPEMVAGGIDPRVLGLYHGVPLNRRSVSFGAPYADTIHLFRANLERVCATREALVERIRVVVWHETAHFFGYTEAQLRRMGLA